MMMSFNVLSETKPNLRLVGCQREQLQCVPPCASRGTLVKARSDRHSGEGGKRPANTNPSVKGVKETYGLCPFLALLKTAVLRRYSSSNLFVFQ